MEIIDLATPSLLFSAISLIMLAYTNRFLAYASVMRQLKKEYAEEKSELQIQQIKNLNKRLTLTRAMQICGLVSLALCVVAMFLIFTGAKTPGHWCFGIALVMLTASLVISIWEINISTIALRINLSDIEPDKKSRKN